MTYFVKSTIWEEEHTLSAESWEEVKDVFKSFIEDGSHPNDITVYEAKEISFTIDYTLIVEPTR